MTVECGVRGLLFPCIPVTVDDTTALGQRVYEGMSPVLQLSWVQF